MHFFNDIQILMNVLKVSTVVFRFAQTLTEVTAAPVILATI